MKRRFLLIMSIFFISFGLAAQQPVQKSNDMKVYMHYMPWFETPETIGKWGWHWTMNNKRPDIIKENGQREIASHYYPLIGPYASRDKDVIEYHLLLMKLSGIDGVLINWYGIEGSNSDIQSLLTNSNAIISSIDDFGLEFGVIMEDRFSQSIADAKANMTYLKDNYFSNPHYIRYGAAEDPLVGIFGPITFQDPSQWSEIIPAAGEDIEFLTLWYESGEAGSNADGEYLWIYQDENDHLTYHLENYYANRAPQMKTVMGVAYPGFDDFYAEGNAGTGYFYIPHNDGQTLANTIAKLKEHESKIDMVQLATWNDFGEGTIFEPTEETGFDYLKQVQNYTGVAYGEEELKLVYNLYNLRKDYESDPDTQQQLDQASKHLSNLEIEDAKIILEAIAPVTGLLEEKEKVRPNELHIYPNPISEGTLSVNFDSEISQNTQISIIDSVGKMVYNIKLTKGTSSISISREILSNGVYTVRLYNDNEMRAHKIIVN